MHRRTFLAAALAAAFIAPGAGLAHHGWGWASGDTFEIAGTITAVRLGNPHGVVTIDSGGEDWQIEIGQPWRNERAGLTEEVLAIGAEMAVVGNRSLNEAERLVKAVRVSIGGSEYDLYPGRAS